MPAFERIATGFPGLDQVLDNIRLGDNVVMQVGSIHDFAFFAKRFATQAIADKRRTVYMRFAQHEALLEEQDGLEIFELQANKGFESFTVDVHHIISEVGKEAIYIFDSLSSLQVIWSTDLMMGNFFCVTCPYLFQLDTVAYFPILRGHHDFATIARIQSTTQLLLDFIRTETAMFLRPIKVWQRYTPEMFLPYSVTEEGEFVQLTSGVELGDYYKAMHEESGAFHVANLDSYERFFMQAKEEHAQGKLSDWTVSKIIRSMMSHDLQIAALIKQEFTSDDLFFIKTRVIGTGTIGGKACGMLLARKITENYLPQYQGQMEPHDSYYIGTDVFYSYLVDNKLWELRIRQREKENYFELADEMAAGLLAGEFSQGTREQFRRMLEYFGQIPIIVRSSSFLEDGFGNAFAGKYESLFCANACSPEQRLQEFEAAVKRVYASTMSHSALEYRRQRGLTESDEQMAILVQRVSGNWFGNYYMPCIAGVGFSYSVYRWSESLSSDAGMLRIVAGLGTRAVDRSGLDYPRMINLDKPDSSIHLDSAEKHRFSQRKLDLISMRDNALIGMPYSQLEAELPAWYIKLISERDNEAERLARESGHNRRISFVSCKAVAENRELMEMLAKILRLLEEKYRIPVDIEYTINFNEQGQYIVNLLQCRPLNIWQSQVGVEISEKPEEQLLFDLRENFMGNAAELTIDVVIFIEIKGYHELPYNQKSSLAKLVGKLNRHFQDSGKTIMLFSPGRIGTTSPELGVPLKFSDLSNFKVLCEYADRSVGLVPELSYGSHIFQDIVEAEMFYVALMDNPDSHEVFRPQLLQNQPSKLSEITEASPEEEAIVKVYYFDQKRPLKLQADLRRSRVQAYLEEEPTH